MPVKISEEIKHNETVSRFINSNKVLDFEPADRTFLQVLATLDAGRIVLAGHIHTVFIIVIANNAGIWIALFTHTLC